MIVRHLYRFTYICMDISVECRSNVANKYKFEGNELIGQGLADIRQSETPAMLCKLVTQVLQCSCLFRNTFVS